jgi:hypothetical protein
MKLRKIEEPVRKSIDWERIVAKLRAHPGQWYQTEIPKTAANPWLIKSGLSPSAFREGVFDARSVNGMLALVYLGEQHADPDDVAASEG